MQPAPDDILLSALESLLLIAGGPVAVDRLASVVGEPRSRVAVLLSAVEGRLPAGLRLQRLGDEVQLVTAPENADYVQTFLGTQKPPPLSRAALETLTVIAYRQPVTRPEIEEIRGVNSDRAVHTLLARGLIEEHGQRPVLGRPTEYGTSFGFLEYFGLSSLADLPPLPDEGKEVARSSDLGFRQTLEHEAAGRER